MQFDKDIQSEHKDLFLSAREFLLSFDGVIETKKDRITTYRNKTRWNMSHTNNALWYRFWFFERCQNER